MGIDLKPILRERGLKQRDLADRLGVSEATISQWLSGLRQVRGRRVPAEHAKALAAEIGIGAHLVRPDLFGPAEAA